MGVSEAFRNWSSKFRQFKLILYSVKCSDRNALIEQSTTLIEKSHFKNVKLLFHDTIIVQEISSLVNMQVKP